MDPITAAMLASGGMALGGGIWSNIQGGAESKRARQWSERMSSTAWQRGRADMEAAGFNPALAFGQGPAQTPGASTATFDDVVSPAVSTAMQARSQASQLKLVDEQARKAKYEADSASIDSIMKRRANTYDDQKWLYYFNQDGTPKAALQDLVKSEFNQKIATSARDVSAAQLEALSIPEREALARLFETAGGGGKALQLLLPLLTSFIRR